VTTFLTFRHDPFIFSGLRLHSAFLDKKGVIDEYTGRRNCRTISMQSRPSHPRLGSTLGPRSPKVEADPLKGSCCRFESDRGHCD
jgi:hypothetical protein